MNANAAAFIDFIENMHDAMFVLDENLNIVDANAMVKLWYGYTKGEAKKLTLHDIRSPDTRNNIAEQVKDVLEHGGGSWETVHVRKDGTTFPVEVSCTPVMLNGTQHFFHVIRDITQRKRMEEEIRISGLVYHQIVDLSPDTIYIHRDGKILFMNQAGFKLFGATSPEQIIGKEIWMLYPPERHGLVRARNQQMEKTKQAVPLIEHVMTRLDGKAINVEAIARPIIYEGKDAFYVIIHDITDRKRTTTYLELQNAVAKQLIEGDNAVECVNEILKIICDKFNYELSSIWLLDPKDNMLHCFGSYEKILNDKTLKMFGYQSTRDTSAADVTAALNTNQPLWFDDAAKDFPEEFRDEELRHLVMIPIVYGHQTKGFIELRASKPHDFEQGILNALLAISSQIGSYIQRKEAEKELLFISRHHRITGMANREFFIEILKYKLNFSQDNGRPLALILISVTGLANITESMGHTAVDTLVREIALRVEHVCGDAEDIGSFRADEIAVMVSNITQESKLVEFVNKLNSALAETFVVQNQAVNISANFGIATSPKDGIDADTLIRSATIALAAAKELGKGAIQFCNPEMTARAKRKLRLEQEMRTGLDNNEFFLNYQPVVDAQSRIVTGFESLLRWMHEGNLVSPGEFIPVAENSDFIIFLGQWIMQAAAQQSKIWNENSDHEVCVAVNVSAVQFSKSSVPEILANILKETQLEPRCLKIELTESSLMNDIQKSIKTLTKIKDLGVKISIDDFGTGYSSLNYLRHLPIDYIKIDQSFVKNMLTNEHDAAIIRTIADLANNLGYKMIAEGVETQQQLDYLAKIGNFEIQGYFFGRPMSVAEATEFLQLGKIT